MEGSIQTHKDAMDRPPVNPDASDYIPQEDKVKVPMDDFARSDTAAHLVHFDPDKAVSPVERLIENGLADQIEGCGGEC